MSRYSFRNEKIQVTGVIARFPKTLTLPSSPHRVPNKSVSLQVRIRLFPRLGALPETLRFSTIPVNPEKQAPWTRRLPRNDVEVPLIEF